MPAGHGGSSVAGIVPHLADPPVHLDGDALRRALRRPGEALPEVRETHCSWVVLTGDRAFKLKRPVRFAFVDQSSPAQRRRLCEEEVRLNQELAASVVLGVRGVVADRGGLRLTDPDAAGAVDWVVEMRRFDDADTLAGRAAATGLDVTAVVAVAERVAAFHAGAPRHPEVVAARVVDVVFENLRELRELDDPALPAVRLHALECFARAFTEQRAGLLERRAR